MVATHEIPTVDMEIRENLGTRSTKRVRDAGRLPVVIYGHKQDPVHASADYKTFTEMLFHHAHVIQVKTPGGTESCLIKAVQWDHMGDNILHVDLARVDLNESVEVEVELELIGDAPGLKHAGAVMDHILTQIAIECRASDIPESIKTSIETLDVGHALTAKDVELPDGITLKTDPDAVIATVHVKAAVEDEELESAEAADGEPEVIGRKTEDEGEAASE